MNELNEYGIPLHACNGYIQDEHVWARLTHMRVNRLHPPEVMAFLDWAATYRSNT